MTTIETRITLYRRHCEERGRYLAELQSLAQRLRADGGRLRAEIEHAVVVGAPASALLKRHGKLARTLAAIEGQIAAAGDALAAAARELKRHELAAARRAHDAGVSDGRRPYRSSRVRQVVPGPGS